MSDAAALAGMLPFDSMGLYEQPKPRFIFKMPRVVPDQKAKFESDDLFKRLSRESEVRYYSIRSNVTTNTPSFIILMEKRILFSQSNICMNHY